jgi:HEAT repeats
MAWQGESPHNTEMGTQQLDLFAAGGIRPTGVPDDGPRKPVCMAELSDSGLIESILSAGLSDCAALTEEAARRGLRAAVPALETLCRRFKGFGLRRSVPEQVSALRALATLGGSDAAAAIRRLIDAAVVQGPGLGEATRAAASLRCRLAEVTAMALLRHADPEVRAAACWCVPNTGAVAAVLQELLGDLHRSVETAAACALGRMGRAEARPALLQLLRAAPCGEAIEAVTRLADEEVVVLLGRIARAHTTLREAALAALEDIDTPRSAAVLAGINAGRVEPGGRRFSN